jgi:large subunit ribosomal protein L23
VDRRANKIEIRKAVERLLKVTVDDVHVINIKGKKKRTGRIIGKRGIGKSGCNACPRKHY